MTAGYEALRKGAAWIDLSAHGRINVSGEDRARLLHALTTNHIQQMKPGDRAYAFFLTAQGRILSDVYIVCYEERFLLDVEPETREAVLQHVDHYIIADDVVLEDVTQLTFCLEVKGERIYGDIADKDALVACLQDEGFVEASAADAEIFRITQFHPRYGADIRPTTLAQETGLPHALHFSKGCYLGQEIVERVRSRGQIKRTLMGLTADGGKPVDPETEVTLSGQKIGKVTSSMYDPEIGLRAIAMLRLEEVKPGSEVQVDGVNATVTAVS